MSISLSPGTIVCCKLLYQFSTDVPHWNFFSSVRVTGGDVYVAAIVGRLTPVVCSNHSTQRVDFYCRDNKNLLTTYEDWHAQSSLNSWQPRLTFGKHKSTKDRSWRLQTRRDWFTEIYSRRHVRTDSHRKSISTEAKMQNKSQKTKQLTGHQCFVWHGGVSEVLWLDLLCVVSELNLGLCHTIRCLFRVSLRRKRDITYYTCALVVAETHFKQFKKLYVAQLWFHFSVLGAASEAFNRLDELDDWSCLPA